MISPGAAVSAPFAQDSSWEPEGCTCLVHISEQHVWLWLEESWPGIRPPPPLEAFL
jgi:hypothetical protein